MENKNKVTWTEEQQKVISLRNCNILVSAAAGSGKTAVLVERIITKITEGESPIDIDRLLVVTFTNAAAGEMRERVQNAIEKKLELEPDNVHLQKQANLVRNAQITTLHSFCQNVIKNHFNEIDLDPGFRIGDEAELKLIKQEVLEALFEQWYEMGEENFLALIECYATNKSDQPVMEMVKSLYEFSMSYPWPEKWLDDKMKSFEITTIEEMEKSSWLNYMLTYIEEMGRGALKKSQKALKITKSPGGPFMYEEALVSDIAFLEAFVQAGSYSEKSTILLENKWKRLSAKKDDSVIGEKREQVKELRESVKKAVESLEKQFFFQDVQAMLEDIIGLKDTMSTLVALTKSFKMAYEAKKEEKRLLDFSDLEHFALKILIKEENGEKVPSPVALEYSNFFDEILVDEYQDSNGVQETILNSITKEKFGTPNLFMVGDVKQSIYKFRLARPELFMEKYDTYSLTEGLYQRIDLFKNFRSREIVLSSVNKIFEKIMQKSLGNISYDARAALYVGNTSFPMEGRVSTSTELLLITDEEIEREEDGEKNDNEKKSQENKQVLSQEEQDLSSKELEARMVAQQIKKLVDPDNGLEVVDKNGGGKRCCQYGDIVILLRSMTGWAEIFLEALNAEGIPTYTDTRTGYFSTFEIRTILQYLKILDNPRQDIPLVTVLRSPLGNFTGEELAIMRKRYKDMEWLDTLELFSGMWQLVMEEPDKYFLSQEEIELSKKAWKFMEQLEDFRGRLCYSSIHEIIEQIYDEIGYLSFVSVMPNGNQRRENLMLLLQKAIEYEKTSYSTLFHFVRYIEKLHKYEVDFGEATGTDISENAVKIMTIHKSKGLEFPVVFLSGMGKNFNNQDIRNKICMDMELGMGVDYVDYKMRIKMPSLIKKVIQRKSVLENLSEELRVLYVALTRAKEKLIMTGYIEETTKQISAWYEKLDEEDTEMDYFERTSAKGYLDWVAPIVLHNKGEFHFEITHLENLVTTEVEKHIKAFGKREELFHWNTDQIYEENLREKLEARFSYEYPFENERLLKSKVSVTELKKMYSLSEDEAGLVEVVDEQELETQIPLPEFLKEEKKEKSGADRGTLYHKLMECLCFAEVKQEADLYHQLEQLIAKGIFTKEDMKIFQFKKILSFFESSLGKRMTKAEQKQNLWREAPFVIGIPACEIKEEWNSEELVLVQGIIDAYFEEEDGLVLMDYKTDRLEKEVLFIERYEAQLTYYKKALEQITGKKVKEKWIYSFHLGREIKV